MAKVSVECPGCFAKLNLSDRSKLGKKIKCPKCAEVFLAEAPDDEDEDEFLEDEDEKPAKPSGGRKRPTTGGGKKSGKQSGGNQGLLIGGGVAALALLIVAGLYFGGVFGGKQPLPAPNAVAVEAVPPPVAAPQKIEISPAEKMLALRWMPADTELLVHLKVADIWQAPLLKAAFDSPQVVAGVAEFQKQTGLLPTEIESVTLGVADLTGALLRSKSAGSPQPVPPGAGPPGFGPAGMPSNPFASIRPEDQRVVVVIRTKKPVDFMTLTKSLPGVQQKDKNGKPYVEAPSLPQQPSSGGWAPDANTVIFATMTDLLATIDRGETVTPRKEFSGVDHTSHLVLASVVKETKPEDLPAGVQVPAALAMMQESLKQYGMQGASLGLSIKGGFDLNVAVLSGSADGSKKLKTDIDTQLAELKSQFSLIKATAPPLLGDLGQLLIDNLKISEQSQMVKVATGIPDSEQSKLEQLPPLLMVMAMTGGLNPLAGAGGGPPAGPLEVSPETPASLGDMKKPEETEAVESVQADGLPEGVSMTCRSSWSEFSGFSDDGKQSFPVMLILDVKGDALEDICAYGQVSTKAISLEGGRELKPFKDKLLLIPDTYGFMMPFQPGDETSLDHPNGTMRVKFAVGAPSTPATKLTSLEGTFKYFTSDKVEEFTIEEAAKKALKPLAEPGLKSAGVKLVLTKAPLGGDLLKLSCAKGHFIEKAELSITGDPAGASISFQQTIEKNLPVHTVLNVSDNGKFPDKTLVKFRLHRDIKEHPVTFRFENVPLPTPDSKPKSDAP